MGDMPATIHSGSTHGPADRKTGPLQFRLPPTAAAPHLGRRSIGQLAGQVPAEVLQRAELLVSELVTNSGKHGSTGLSPRLPCPGRGQTPILHSRVSDTTDTSDTTDRSAGRMAAQVDGARIAAQESRARFPLSQPVPVKLIERIAKLRAKDAANAQPPAPAHATTTPETAIANHDSRPKPS
jgi:hypothetical protein